MSIVTEYRVKWSGGRIGEGFTVLHLEYDAITPIGPVNAAISAWFNSIKPSIPNTITWQFPNEMRQFDSVTGELTAVVAITPTANVTGGSASVDYGAPAGRLVKWATGTVVNGRRLNGHTYLVPTSSNGYSAGSVTSAVQTSDNTAHTTLISALQSAGAPLVIWSRTGGVASTVKSGQTLQRATQLRRRND
jgi:hypothetical protein